MKNRYSGCSFATGSYESIAADHGHDACWSKCNQVVKWRAISRTESSEGAGGGQNPRLELINVSSRFRYFVQFTDKVFGSQVCVTLKHLHRLMSANR